MNVLMCLVLNRFISAPRLDCRPLSTEQANIADRRHMFVGQLNSTSTRTETATLPERRPVSVRRSVTYGKSCVSAPGRLKTSATPRDPGIGRHQVECPSRAPFSCRRDHPIRHPTVPVMTDISTKPSRSRSRLAEQREMCSCSLKPVSCGQMPRFK